jgi:hypothetical protein
MKKEMTTMRHCAILLALFLIGPLMPTSTPAQQGGTMYFRLTDNYHNCVLGGGCESDNEDAWHYRPKDNGGDQYQWGCAAGDNSMWSFRPVAGGNYEIVNRRYSNTVLAWNYRNNGIYLVNRGTPQNNCDCYTTWKVESIPGEGLYRISSAARQDWVLATPDVWNERPVMRNNAGDRDIAKWKLDVAQPGKGPAFYPVSTKSGDVHYDMDATSNVNDAPLITLDQTLKNETSATQSMTIRKAVSDASTETWTFQRAVTAEITAEISLKFGNGLFGAETTAKIGTKLGTTITNGNSTSRTVTNQIEWSVPASVPASSQLKVTGVFKKLVKDIPFSVDVVTTYGDGTTKTEVVKGVYRGTDYAESDIKFQQLTLAGAPVGAPQPAVVATTQPTVSKPDKLAAVADAGYSSTGPTSTPTPAPSTGTAVKRVVNLKSSNGRFMVAEQGGGAVVNANRDAAGPWESFTLVDLNGGELADGDKVALQAMNGQYVCAEQGGGGVVNANRQAVGPWETFTFKRLAGGKVALQAMNGQFVCAEGGGGGKLIANRGAVGDWESFTLIEKK